ncbi:hypothetical protein Tco_0527227 [Tanacetum coccineum]
MPGPTDGANVEAYLRGPLGLGKQASNIRIIWFSFGSFRGGSFGGVSFGSSAESKSVVQLRLLWWLLQLLHTLDENHLIRRIHQLDTTYQTFYLERRIEFYSLNSVSVFQAIRRNLRTQYGVLTFNRPIRQSGDRLLQLRMVPSYDDARNGNGEHNNSRMITTSELKISDEFLKILQDNAFNGMDGGDVTDHIAKVLEITEWIKMPNVEKNELRLHVFSKSLSGDAKTWWNNEINETTIT